MTIIPTFILDKIIAESRGALTINELRAAQLALLPYDCPNCNEGSGLIDIPAPDSEVLKIQDPLCGGMGKLATEYLKVCDSFHYATEEGALPTPPPVTDDTGTTL